MRKDEAVFQEPPLGLYVHFPWCISKCPYCDFNSHEIHGAIPAEAYTKALLGDLECDLRMVSGRQVSSIYFGGGTPSLFSAGHIESLLRAFGQRLDIAGGAEVTLEANPGTIERDSFAAYRQAGINRISLGAQSFSDKCLGAIGRIHGSSEVRSAIASLHEADYTSFNIDLMFGLPGQTVKQAMADIESAIDCGAPHISFYQLTVEPNTAFAAQPPRLPGHELCWQMQTMAEAHLGQHGFRQYEISAWSKEGHRCDHNINYWRYGDFLGLGAGAHGKLTDVRKGRVRRISKHRHPRSYLAGERVAEDRISGDGERVFEFFLNRLRLREGFTERQFLTGTGLPWGVVSARVEEAVGKGLLEERQGRYLHTGLGWRFVNDIQAMFLPG